MLQVLNLSLKFSHGSPSGEWRDKAGPQAAGGGDYTTAGHPQNDRDRGFTVDTITQPCMFNDKTALKPGDQVSLGDLANFKASNHPVY